MERDCLVPGHLVLESRDVHFDWAGLPAGWIPGEPQASHIINVLHLLLPEGERWFVDTFKRALPLITDDALREDVIGFIGQEALHAEAHQGVLDYFATQGLGSYHPAQEASTRQAVAYLASSPAARATAR
jgi:hypothetical protein